MREFWSCESRQLSSPLSNKTCRYLCFKVSNPIHNECLWFIQSIYYNGQVLNIRVFTDEKEFERFYNKLKRSFRDEKVTKDEFCPVAGFEQGEEVSF